MAKTWIITGSSRGLGRALAEAALAAGEKVAATARRVDDLQDLRDRYGDQVLLLPLDVTNETQAIEAVASTIRTFNSNVREREGAELIFEPRDVPESRLMAHTSATAMNCC